VVLLVNQIQPVNNAIMSTAPSTGRSVSESKWLDALPYIIFSLVGLIGLVGVVFIFGRVSGEEFSPEAFQRRRYWFYQIPVLKIQISPVAHENVSTGLEDRIATDIKAVNTTDPSVTWDIVTANRAGRSVYSGDARILCDSLEIGDTSGNLVWEEWTDDHKELATLLWPLVAEVARARLYVLIPDLLDIAQSASSVIEVGQELTDYLEVESLKIALSLQQNSQHAFAILAFDLALKQDSNSPQALQGRARSKAALGDVRNSTDSGESVGKDPMEQPSGSSATLQKKS